MKANFSTSINIIRDIDKDFDYIPTSNAHRIYQEILQGFVVGIHSFNIIGTYGTGKSAFLLALEKSLNGDKSFFAPVNGQLKGFKNFRFINFVGDYVSIIKTFSEYFHAGDLLKKKIIFDELDKLYASAQNDNEFLFIVIDEFGKFLEYAAQNNPENELFFIQQLAEYVTDKNIIFITTLHQSFGAYSKNLYHAQQQEWEKVKGRLKELTFNEPVEQLLFLAAKKISEKQSIYNNSSLPQLLALSEKANAFPLKRDLSMELAKKLFPLDIIAASIITLALQKYGQNERSLFTFLELNEFLGINDVKNLHDPYYNLGNVYDYLLHNYYSFISTQYNPDYLQWSAIKKAIERVEGEFEENFVDALKLVKTIGLLNIFGKESAKLDKQFISGYARICLDVEDPERLLNVLESHKIIRFLNYKSRFILFEGTDLNIDQALLNAANKIDHVADIIPLLKKYFTFPYISAKAAHYKYGTPRFFEFELSASPIKKTPTDEVDGVINLIFSDHLAEEKIVDFSNLIQEAILFGFYKNSKQIKEILVEIQKVEYVIDSIEDDRVALRELRNILENQIERLNEQVISKLYSGSRDITWIFNGEKIKIKNQSDFNSTLSKICEDIYHATPIFQNELVNRHKLSASITIARKKFFHALLNDSNKEDLGFSKDKFPAEKTIYFTLLKKTGIHQAKDGEFVLSSPTERSFKTLWNSSEQFLNNAKFNRKKLSELVEVFSTKPLKLKRGFIDFWLPVFLFIKRDDFALFGENGYIPFITTEVLDLVHKKPDKFQIKTFDVTGIKLDLFNKYRSLLDKDANENFSNTSFIDTIKPFLTFYKELPEYTKKTKRLSQSALALRNAIADATDPEKTFFENFPKALGYSDLDLKDDTETLGNYIFQLQNAIRELRTCFDNLIDRIEAYLLSELGYTNLSFQEYKNHLRKRFKFIKQHLLLPYQKTFLMRVQSELNDRRTWMTSLVNALLEKNLDRLKDEEEELVFDRFSQIILELDNLCEISKSDINPDEEDFLKLAVTSLQEGHKEFLLRIPKSKNKIVQSVESSLRAQLSKDKKTNIAVLTKLLKEQLSNGQG